MLETAIIYPCANASYRGHKILDWETKQEVGELSSRQRSMNVIPSSYVMMFGKSELPITLKANERLVVKAVSVHIKGVGINTRSIYNEAGTEVASVSTTSSSATLLPGKYILQLRDQKVPFEIKAGANMKIQLK